MTVGEARFRFTTGEITLIGGLVGAVIVFVATGFDLASAIVGGVLGTILFGLLLINMGEAR